MAHSPLSFFSASIALVWTTFAWSAASATHSPPFLNQGFYFDWNTPGQPVPIPTTAQCDTIHLEWSRSTATGPNPTAPYYLLIYTSTFIVPFSVAAGSGLTFDWQVPFAPGTQYQICMFDAYGVTGGCQGIYTVIPAANSSASNPPSCTNVTFPAGAMDVVGAVHNGGFSQYGWIDQCTDLSLIPKNGTPPFTLTIAPSLHPPVNITSNGMDPINWTVTLSWASPFFVSLVDSAGNGWANGPLHSGGGGPTGCLAQGDVTKSLPVAAIIGTGVGAFVVGALITLFASFCLVRRRSRGGYDAVTLHRKGSAGSSGSPTGEAIRPVSDYRDLNSPGSVSGLLGDGAQASANSRMSASTAAQESLVNRLGTGENYHIEPFVLPGVSETKSALHPVRPASLTPGLSSSTTLSPDPSGLSRSTEIETVPRSPPPAPSSSGSSSSRQQASHVYVVHHDGGRAPVSVFTQEGTEVVELPPRYTDAQTPTHQQSRRPGSTRKPPGTRRTPDTPE